MYRCLFILIVLGNTLLIPPGRAAENPQDFTGVWLAYASEAADPRPISDLLTQEGETLVADFNSLYPNIVEADSFCAPAGMPAVMSTVEGRPIEIIHSDKRITVLAALGQVR